MIDSHPFFDDFCLARKWRLVHFSSASSATGPGDCDSAHQQGSKHRLRFMHLRRNETYDTVPLDDTAKTKIFLVAAADFLAAIRQQD